MATGAQLTWTGRRGRRNLRGLANAYGKLNRGWQPASMEPNLGPPAYARMTRPPSGTYDPSIDSSERAAQRGYRDLEADTAKGATRAGLDYGIGLEDIGRTRDWGIADLNRADERGTQDFATRREGVARDYSRGVADINLGRDRATEDHSQALTDLTRRYSLLATNQGQAAAAAGAGAGGALRQALAKRTENRGIDQKPIDTSYSRYNEDAGNRERLLTENRDLANQDIDRSQHRFSEDSQTQRERRALQYGDDPGDYGFEGQRLSLGYQRGEEDRATGLRRAGRELTEFSQDLVPVRYYSAAGLTPWTPKKRRRRTR